MFGFNNFLSYKKFLIKTTDEKKREKKNSTFLTRKEKKSFFSPSIIFLIKTIIL